MSAPTFESITTTEKIISSEAGRQPDPRDLTPAEDDRLTAAAAVLLKWLFETLLPPELTATTKVGESDVA